jgi:hypothetical protein
MEWVIYYFYILCDLKKMFISLLNIRNQDWFRAIEAGADTFCTISKN